MNQTQADQLRRAIARLVTARVDVDYARLHEPRNVDKAEAHHARCVRRLDALITQLTAKPVSHESAKVKTVKQSGVFPM